MLHGVNQARTWRSATGHDSRAAGSAPMTGRLRPPRGRRGGLGLGRWGLFGEDGLPAEAERAAHQRPVPADRPVRADLELGPAELAFDLLVALLNPVTQPVQAHDVSELSLLSTARRRPGQVGQQIPAAMPGRLAGSVLATTSRSRRSGPQPPS